VINFLNFDLKFVENFIDEQNQNSNLTSQQIYNLNLNIVHQKYQVKYIQHIVLETRGEFNGQFKFD
jgi:hypothetical protein